MGDMEGNAAAPASEAAAAVETADDDSGRAWEQEPLGRDGDGRRQDGAKGHARNWQSDWEKCRSGGEDRTDIREQQRRDAENGMAEANEAWSAGAVTWLAAARWYRTTRTDEAVCYQGKLDPSLCIVDRARDTQAHSRR